MGGGERVSIEVYLLVNLAADMALLAAAARALGCFDGRRLFAAGLVCAAYAVLAAVTPVPWSGAWLQGALCLGVAGLLAWRRGARVWRRLVLLLVVEALLAGGFQILIPGVRGPLGALCAALAALLTALLLMARHPFRPNWTVRLTLDAEGRCTRFPALIDTGNRLREPISGQPVVIAEASLLRGVLPRNGWRELRFGAIGSEGRMACFKPSRLWIERGRGRTRAPDVWIAVSPTPLPGDARALAPVEFVAFAE